jgi:hypothetical protein
MAKMNIEVGINISLPFWTLIKLRLCGCSCKKLSEALELKLNDIDMEEDKK